MAVKVKMEVAEMTDPRVKFISLVGKGANGQPFKRFKSDDRGEGDVIQFKDVFKGGPEGPVLVALAVGECGDVEAARTIAKAAGIVIEAEREADGTTLLLPDERRRVNTDSGRQVVVQLAEELAAVCQVAKEFRPFNGTTSFAEAMQSQNFFPQLSGALSTFGNVAYQIMEESGDPGEAASMIEKAADEFKDVVVGLAQALPRDVFKTAEVLKSLAAAETAEASVEKAETPEDDEAGEAETAVEKAETETETETEAGAAEGEQETQVAAPGDDSELATVLKGLSDQIAGVNERLDEIGGRLDEVEDVASDAAATAAAVRKATRGAVLSDPAGDGEDHIVSKGDAGLALLDTGMSARASW